MRPYNALRRGLVRGYTLIELIIVMAVLALAAALLVPNIVGRDIMTASAATRLLISDLSFAANDALANQEFRRVVFFDDGTGYCIIKVASYDTVTPTVIDETTVEYVYDPLGGLGRFVRDFTKDKRFEGVEISAATIDGVTMAADVRPEITFDTFGGTIQPGNAPGQGGSVTITYDGTSYRIDIAPFTGKMTIVRL